MSSLDSFSITSHPISFTTYNESVNPARVLLVDRYHRVVGESYETDQDGMVVITKDHTGYNPEPFVVAVDAPYIIDDNGDTRVPNL